MVGEESVLLAQRSGCAVAAGPDRVAAALALLQTGCNLLISDDGLQHLRLGRDIEIAVVDGERRHGNGRCLPAGPLREPPSRLASCDFVVANGAALEREIPMRYRQGNPISLSNPTEERPWADFVASEVHALAGIGHPARFFADLAAKGLVVHAHAYPDHHPFTERDISFGDGLPVLMTEKDAVKCARFARDNHWYVPVEIDIPVDFERRLLLRLRGELNGQEAA
jgi:tetraacyldisaccharide 4'-kinase